MLWISELSRSRVAARPAFGALRLVVALVVLLFAGPVWAVTCDYETQTGTATNNMPYFPNPYGSQVHAVTVSLGARSITVGRDLPAGSVLYRESLKIASSSAFMLSCQPGAGTLRSNRRLLTTPLPLLPWNAGPYAGKVYESGVSGIGVAITQTTSDTPLPQLGTAFQNCNDTAACHWTWDTGLQAVDVVLIKTGPVTAGVIQGAQLPTIQVDFQATNATPLLKVDFSGQLSVVATTCQTDDVEVEMGSQRLSQLTGVGSAGEWKPFEIKLTNCPAFYGRYPIRGDITFSDTTGLGPTATVVNNTLDFAILPSSGTLDAARGLMALSPVGESGVAAAQGVALQLSRDDAASSPVVLGESNSTGLALQQSAGLSYSIKLKARYYQYQATVGPGSGEATALYQLSYQ